MGRPLVTSDHAVLRDYYADAAVYAAASSASLRDAVAAALGARIAALRPVRQSEWERAAARLRAAVGRPA